ncbi:MAG TPA: TonB-dependent receptor [Blastocatellia bacterium]|nr:TonB-dependent receptor [Blastocatellia bacterium]
MQRIWVRFAHAAFCGLVLSCLATTTSAQFKASIQGTVTDQSGAVISGVTVTATNLDTSKHQSTVTSGEGFYRITELPPGTYTITAELSGFKKQTISDVVVHAEQAQGVNVVLETGQISEAVTVNASPETGQLQTETPNIDRAITNKEVLELPQVGRDPYDLLRLTPGVFGDMARAGNGQALNLPNTTGPGGSNTSIFQVENQVPISANGQRISANNFNIDGVSVNSLANGGAAVVTPNQESVKEIRVITSPYSAEYGRNSGAQIEVVSQNGTNQFHGSGVFKYNDPKFNAFNKYGGISGDPTKSAPPVRVEDLFRQFAGSVGGPIIKNKLFFFFSYEGLRNNSTGFRDAFIETSAYRQLVIAQRPGSITAKVFQSPGATPRVISVLPTDCAIFGNDPTKCRVVPGGIDIGSPTGATGQYVSLGNPTGGGFDGIPDLQFARLALPNIVHGDQYNSRIDYNLGSNNQFAFSSYFTHRSDLQSNSPGDSRPMEDLTFKPLNSALTVTWIRTLSATMLNEARANFTRFAFNQITSNSNVDFGIPRIEVESYPFDRVRFGADRSETTPAVFAENTFEVRDMLSKVFGNHATRFGAEIRREQDNNSLAGGARPLYSFSGLWNLANGTPIFEAINADPRSGLPADAQRYFRTGDYGFFAQDDWKFRPNLTFNIGLRYEYFTPLTEARDHITNLTFPTGNLLNAKLVQTNQLFQPDRNNFAPRLGFAWSPAQGEQKLVIRGGFGIAYNRTPGALFSNTRGNPPFFARYNICCGTASTDFGTPFVGGHILYALGSSNSPFSFPINPVLAQGIDPNTGGVIGNQVEIWGTEPKMPNAYVYFYSFDTEYQLPHNLIAGLGYQGSSSHKLVRIVDMTLIYPTNQEFNPVFFLIPDVNANYNALLARLTHTFSHGFTAAAYYRWSKSIDTLSFEGPGAVTNQTNPGDLPSERGPSDYDARHSLVLSGVWELPLARGRQGWTGRLLAGWGINGIWTYHTGFPYTPKLFLDLRQPSGKTFGPIRPVKYFGGALDDSSNNAFIRPGGNFPGGGAKFFDTTTVGPPGIGRNSFRGPKFNSIDLSLVKQTRFGKIRGLGESTALEVRANLFNAFNQLNLAPIGFFDPGSIITDPNFGRSSAGLAGRVIELQVRFSF